MRSGLATVLVTIAATTWIRAAQADDAAPPAWAAKTASWRPELVAPGRGWWCNELWCYRAKKDCDPADTRCWRQTSAWGFSYYTRTGGFWMATVFLNRATCIENREGEMRVDRSIAISPCVKLKDRRAPRSPVPPGEGWWCRRFKQVRFGKETTECVRTELECKDTDATIKVTPARQQESLAGCVLQPTAWMSESAHVEPGMDRTRTFHMTEADCLQFGYSETCKLVE